MNSWYFLSCALIVASSRAYALDHSLLTNATDLGVRSSRLALLDEPAVARTRTKVAKSPINLDQQVRRMPAAPDPGLLDGQRWLCSVGQPPEVNVQAFRRAKAQGWGYWSFAAHARCPAGVYLTIAENGALKATGEKVWTDEPNHSPITANVVTSYLAMPAINPPLRAMQILSQQTAARQPQPVYYAFSDVVGSRYAYGESAASCAACNGGGCASGDAPADYGHVGWISTGDGSGSIAGSSSSYCASCNGR